MQNDRQEPSLVSAVEQQEIKQAVKDAVREAMIENNGTLKDMRVEVIEDLALLQRMEEGRETELISRDEIMGVLGTET